MSQAIGAVIPASLIDHGAEDSGQADAGEVEDAGSPEDAGPQFPFDGGPAPLCDDPALHNGGDGACVPAGTCSVDFFLRPDGRCTAWRQTAPLPQPAQSLRLVVRGTDLYAVGTFDFELDPPIDARTRLVDGELEPWTPIPSPEPPRYGPGAAIVDDMLVLVGGMLPPHLTATDEILVARLAADGAFTAWESAPQKLLVARGVPAAFILDGQIVVSGGYDGNTGYSSFEVISPGPDGTLGAPVFRGSTPEPLAGHHAFIVDDGVVLAGGGASIFSNDWSLRSVDTNLEQWDAAPGFGLTRRPCIVAASGALIAIGGYQSYAGIGTKAGGLVFIADLDAGLGVGAWRPAGIMDFERLVGDCVQVGEYIVIAGGDPGGPDTIDSVSIAKTDAVLRSVEAP